MSVHCCHNMRSFHLVWINIHLILINWPQYVSKLKERKDAKGCNCVWMLWNSKQGFRLPLNMSFTVPLSLRMFSYSPFFQSHSRIKSLNQIRNTQRLFICACIEKITSMPLRGLTPVARSWISKTTPTYFSVCTYFPSCLAVLTPKADAIASPCGTKATVRCFWEERENQWEAFSW